MVQTRRSNLKSRSWRLEQPIRKKPYYETIVYGMLLGYRRTKDAGTWVVRVTRDGSDWTKAIGKADDYDKPDGKTILDYDRAQDEAKKLANTGKPLDDSTVAAALDRYEADLESRGGDLRGVSRVHLHLTYKLKKRLVSSLTNDDLKDWRDSLKNKMKPASVNRTITALRAALNLASEGDRTANREAWRSGLKDIPGAGKARNVILSESDLRALIGAAYRDSDEFGLLVEVAAVTGSRPSQLLRLQGEDVQAGFTDPKTKKRQPRLMMPVSRKGRGEKKIAKRPVPIPASLADRLAGVTGQLLRRPDGESWERTNLPRHFEGIMRGVKFSQPKVTMYALRHTSIVRQLLAGVPIRVVAALHDTSVKMIEQNYSEYIADHADELVRPALFETMAEVLALPPPTTKARAKKGVPEAPA
jgi:integrase